MKYTIKIDISGIQKFIFDIPSKGASKELKARSFYVYALTHFILEMMHEKFGKERVEEIYNGGGNLFAFVDVEKETELYEFRKKIEALKFEGEGILFPFISFTKAEINENAEIDFKESMKVLNKEVLKVKLQRKFNTEPFEAKNKFADEWKTFTENLSNGFGFTIKNGPQKGNQIVLDEYYLDFSGDNFEGSILNKLPKDKDGSITEFKTIAEISKKEGADEKIAALKMDVDNLGTLFRDREREEYKKLSSEMGDFFEKTLYKEVLKEKIERQEIYPVFAGGDDLFLIGSWHIIIEVAVKINEAFKNFQKGLNIGRDLSLSGGIVVAKPAYPMIRIAEEAEEALERAKKYRNGAKNSISLFGEPMSWKEFEKCTEIKNKLLGLVEDGESKAVLQRMKSSDLGFRSIQEKMTKTNVIDLPKVYRLKYYLRNAKNEENRKVLEEIFDEYAEDLLNDFLNSNEKEKSNPAKYVVAARWAELLIRNKIEN